MSQNTRQAKRRTVLTSDRCTCGVSWIRVLVFGARQFVVTLHEGRLMQLTMCLMPKLERIPRTVVPPFDVVCSGGMTTPTAQHHGQGASRPRDAYINRWPSRQSLDTSRSWHRKGATRPILTTTNSADIVEAGPCGGRRYRHRRCCMATRRPTPVRKNGRSTPVAPRHDADSDLVVRPHCLI